MPGQNVTSWLLSGISSLVQFGVGGPRLKNLLGVLQVRLPDDSGFGKISAATPVDPEDLTTKAYVDGAIGAISGAQSVFWAFTFADFPGDKDALSDIPTGALITGAYVNVTSVFSAGTIDLGLPAFTDYLFGQGPPAGIDLTTVGIQGGVFSKAWPLINKPRATLAGAPGFGEGTCRVDYVIASP
jgi:hypothetical protein